MSANSPPIRQPGTYSRLDILRSLASGEVGNGAVGEGRRDGDDLRAVDERALVDAEERQAAHDVRERLGELLLVVRERLPLARGAAVARDEEVGLQAHLARDRGDDLALRAAHAGEGLPDELRLDEELGVEDLRGRVEGRARDRRVHPVGGRDGVGGEQPDDFEVLEADVEQTG